MIVAWTRVEAEAVGGGWEEKVSGLYWRYY